MKTALVIYKTTWHSSYLIKLSYYNSDFNTYRYKKCECIIIAAACS